MDQSSKWFYTAALYSNSAYLIIQAATVAYVLVKLKFKMDASGMITLGIFLLGAIIRVVTDL